MLSPVAVIVAEWFLVTLAYTFLGLRLTVRITQRQMNLIWSEVWLVFGALWLLGLVICDTLTFKEGAMDDFTTVTVEILQIRFASNYLFDCGLYFPKMSMLTIYFHIMPRHERVLRWALYFVAIFTIGSFLTTLFMDTFVCGLDIYENWSTDPAACSAFKSELLFRLNWSLCFITEAMLFLLPMPLLRTLRTAKRKELVGLVFLFSLGIITLAVSSGRFATMILIGNDISLYIWATAEFSISQIIVSSMALRPLMKRLWRTVLSTGSRKTSGPQSRHISHPDQQLHHHNLPFHIHDHDSLHDTSLHHSGGRSKDRKHSKTNSSSIIGQVFRKHKSSSSGSGGAGTVYTTTSTTTRALGVGATRLGSDATGSEGGERAGDLWSFDGANSSEVELHRIDQVGREGISHTVKCWSNTGEAGALVPSEGVLDTAAGNGIVLGGNAATTGEAVREPGPGIQQRSSISIELV